ncbi:MAG: TerC family protein, partial [Pseudomonadota bacterium]|nr:TerC family protein [Pseudomonadota bacterium]
MELLTDPQAWLSFWMLAVLEIVLGIDNIIFLAVLVDRLPRIQRRSGRLMGLGFAMLTRIGLLLSITWLTTVRHPLMSWSGHTVTVRNLILGAGGTLLIIKSVMELRDAVRAGGRPRRPGRPHGYWLVILQIGVIDIIFSLDSVFTAVGLASRVEVMIAAIVVSVVAMMAISSVVSLFIDRYPAVKLLALA